MKAFIVLLFFIINCASYCTVVVPLDDVSSQIIRLKNRGDVIVKIDTIKTSNSAIIKYK